MFKVGSLNRNAPIRESTWKFWGKPKRLAEVSAVDVLVAMFSGATAGRPMEALGIAAEQLAGACRVPWLGLYLQVEEGLERVGVAHLEAQENNSESSAAMLPEEEPLAAMPGTVSLSSTQGIDGLKRWLRVPDSNIWLFPAYLAPTKEWLESSSVSAVAALAGALTTLAQAHRAAQKRRAQQVDAEVHRKVVQAAMDPSAMVRLFLDVAIAGFAGQRGFVGLKAKATEAFTALAHRGPITASLDGLRIENLAGQWIVVAERPELIADDAQAVYALARECDEGLIIFVVASAAGARAIGEATVARVERALEVIVSVQNAQAESRRVRERGAAIVDSLVSIIDSTPGTFRHHNRVAAVVEWLSQVFAVPAAEQIALRRAAVIHDVGRVGFPESDATGTAMEFLHPGVGAMLLETFGESKRVAQLVAVHHERFDGMGFPGGTVPNEDDKAAWTLISAECIVEYAESAKLDLVASARQWSLSASAGVLPTRYRGPIEQALSSDSIGDLALVS